MVREVKTVWRLWWEWSPERIEKWLEEKALEGWFLFQVDFASLRFKFIRGKADRVRFCTDYQENPGDDYIKLFKDDGWELVWTGAFGWYIWRKIYSDKRPSIYTDNETIINKTNHSIRVTWTFLLIPIVLFSLLLLLGPVLAMIENVIRLIIILLIVFTLLGFILVNLYRRKRMLSREQIKQ